MSMLMSSTPVRRRSALAAVVVVLGVGLTACAGTDDTTSATNSSEAATSAEPAPGDIMFAQMMIPHHQQAVEMADLALERSTSADVIELAEAIKSAQDPEIQTMTAWLESWGADLPEDMSGMDHGGMDMGAGMMSDEDMAALAAASGAEFDQMWLEMMIEHHEGALEMAEAVLGTTELPEVRQLAEAVVTGQTAEITTMRGLLGQ